jgi:hypothetical protein
MQEWRAETLPYQLVIFSMGANPEPNDSVWYINPHSSILESDSHRPEPAYLFQMQRRMFGVRFEELVGTISLFADRRRERIVADPKI